MLELIKQLYPLRSCKFNLTEENIKKSKFKVCLDYHIKKCLGPCEGLQNEEDYIQSIAEIRNILKGNTRSIIQPLKTQMQYFAANFEFEKAQEIKEKLEALENYQSKSTVVSPTIHNVDVFTILSDTDSAYINYFKIVNGAIIQSHNLEIKKKLEEADEDLLIMAVLEIREKFHSNTKEIILNKEITKGNLNDFTTGKIMIGGELAYNLNLEIGDKINIVSSSFIDTPFGSIPKQDSFGQFHLYQIQKEKNILEQ